MQVLLVAYEFPPSQSPRALRWQYLARELALLGHEVHVLAPDLGEPGFAFPQQPGRVVLHLTFAGPFGWLEARARRRRAARSTEGAMIPAMPNGESVGLNWRGRLVEAAKKFAGLVLFPDVRIVWNWWARRTLHSMIPTLAPDVVVTSHEPASTLLLGLEACRYGVAWVADLGDPVCAPYTPTRWRDRAFTLEREVCEQADAVVVTHEATRELFVRRHDVDPGRIRVLANGYDDRSSVGSEASPGFDDAMLELAYAGRVYGYRDPGPLIEAVARTPGVRLTMVVPDPPTGSSATTTAKGDRVRILGPRPHAEALRILHGADVLVNFGNIGLPAQIPAKVYEYLGIRRPVLHVGTGAGDLAADFLRGMRRGWICMDDVTELSRLLAELRDRKRASTLGEELDLAPVTHYAHSERGRRLEAMLQEAARMAAARKLPNQPGSQD